MDTSVPKAVKTLRATATSKTSVTSSPAPVNPSPSTLPPVGKSRGPAKTRPKNLPGAAPSIDSATIEVQSNGNSLGGKKKVPKSSPKATELVSSYSPPKGSKASGAAKKSSPGTSADRPADGLYTTKAFDESTLRDFEQDDAPKLKSPYLRCLWDVLEMDGQNKHEITTQNEIMNSFQMLTGIDCGSYISLAKEALTAATTPADEVRKYCKNPKSLSDKCPPSKAKAKKGKVPPAEESLMKASKTYKPTNQTSSPPPQISPKVKSIKVQPPTSKTQKIGKKATSVDDLSLFLNAENTSPYTKPKNWPEEIRNYFDWRSFCLLRRYGDNTTKLKEKMKLLDEDFAGMPDELMPATAPPRASTAPFKGPTSGTKPAAGDASQKISAKSRKDVIKKSATRNISSSPALKNEVQEIISSPKLFSSPSNSSFKSELTKKITELTAPPSPQKKKGLSLKQEKNKAKAEMEEEDFQNMIRYFTANPYDAPSWELTGLVKIATVYDDDPYQAEEHENVSVSNKAKLKSRFTIKNEQLEHLKSMR